MASEHRIIRTNDLNPKRTRRRRYRRVYKGDVLRVSRATERSTNEVAQSFGLNRNYSLSVNNDDLLVLEVHQGTNKILPPKQGYGSPTISGGVLPVGPIEEVLARFPNPLTEEEIECISTFVQAMTDAGNWDTMESFYHFGLVDPVNALINWAKDGETATANGTASHIPGIGYDFDGGGYVTTNFDPATAVKYGLEDGRHSAFCVENRDLPSDFKTLYANQFVGTDVYFRQRPSTTTIQSAHHENGSGYSGGDGTGRILGDTLYTKGRVGQSGPTAIDFNENGVNIASPGKAPVDLGTGGFVAVGAGNTGANPFDGRISSYSAGYYIGWDDVAYNTLLRELNDCLFIAGIPDRFPNPLEDNEVVAILNFVKKENDAGNWALYDEFFAFGLTDPVNAVSGFKGTLAVNNGAIHEPTQGMGFAGVEWIETNYNPTVNGVNFGLNNGLHGVYVLENALGNTQGIEGTLDGGIHTNIFQDAPGVRFLTNQGTTPQVAGAQYPDGLLIATRPDGNSQKAFYNGVEQPMDFQGAAVALANSTLNVGRLGGGGSTYNWTGKAATWIAGGAVGFDQAAHYANLIEFLVLLDTFAKPVIDSFPNPLTADEEDYVRAFVNSQVLNGNWFKMDSFVALNLLDPANALWDWKRQVSMTNSGGVHQTGIGYQFSGAEWINTVFNPSSDAIAYGLANASMSAFIVDTAPNASLDFPLGVSVATVQSSLYFDQGTSQIKEIINSSAVVLSNTAPATISQKLINGQFEGTTNTIYENGIQTGQNVGATSSALPNGSIFIGARNTDAAATNFFAGTIAAIHIGGALSDQLGYYESLVEFNAKLEAEGIIATFPGVLTATEETAVRNFLVGEITNGNWAKYDSYACFSLSDPLNALWDWKRQVAMTNNGATFDLQGASMGGTGFVDSGYTPSIDGINYLQNNASAAVFVTNLTQETDKSLFGGNLLSFFPLQNCSINSGQVFNLAGNLVTDNSLITLIDDGVNAKYLRNGFEELVNANVTTGVPTLSIPIGKSASFGTIINGTVAIFQIGGGALVHSQNYTNNLELLIELGVFAQPVIDSFPGVLAAGEEDRIREFINSEARVGNWQRMDSFADFTLTDPLNANWDWVRKVPMTPAGAPTHTPGTGYTFNGVDQYIDTGYIPLTDQVNYDLNDCQMEVFNVQVDEAVLRLCGAFGSGGTDRDQLYSDGIGGFIAGLNSNSSLIVAAGPYKDNTLYSVSRNVSTLNMYENGVLIGTSSSNVIAEPDASIYVGGLNNNGVFTTPMTGTIATFMIGGRLANQNSHGVNINTLLGL